MRTNEERSRFKRRQMGTCRIKCKTRAQRTGHVHPETFSTQQRSWWPGCLNGGNLFITKYYTGRMGNRHFDGRMNTLIPCSGIDRETSSSDASSLRSKSSTSSKSDSDSESVSPDHFRVIRTIGKGSFCQVYAVEKRSSRELYAMKLISKDSREDRIHSITNEIEILTSLNHPFLVTLWFAFQDDDTIYLIFELLPGGDLRRSLEDQSHLPEARVLIYISELALALDYLKKKGILHRDIKPENLLLDGQGHIRLTDFNVAIELKEGELATSMSGTKPYIAPEVYKCILNMGPGYSYPADWWSLGICAYEFVCGERPYDVHSRTSYEDILGMILLRKLFFPKRVSSGMTDLIQQILCVDIDQRLSSVEQLQNHPHLADIDFDQLLKKEISETFDELRESVSSLQ